MIEEGEARLAVNLEFANGKTVGVSRLVSIGSFWGDMAMTETEARVVLSLFDNGEPASPEEKEVVKTAREFVEHGGK